MTEKRFTIDLEYDMLEDAKEVFPSICFTDGIDWYTVCEKLNEMNDENEKLKCGNKNLKATLNDFINILNRLQSNPTDKQTIAVARDMLQNMGKELEK